MPINEDVLLSMLDKINSIEAAVAPRLPKLNFIQKCGEYINELRNNKRFNTAICYGRSLRRFFQFSNITDINDLNR